MMRLSTALQSSETWEAQAVRLIKFVAKHRWANLWWLGFLAIIFVPIIVPLEFVRSDIAARHNAVQEVSDGLVRQWGTISIDMGSLDISGNDGLKVTLHLAGCMNVPAHFPAAPAHPASGKALGGLYIDNDADAGHKPIRVDVAPDQFIHALWVNGLWHCVAHNPRMRPPVTAR